MRYSSQQLGTVSPWSKTRHIPNGSSPSSSPCSSPSSYCGESNNLCGNISLYSFAHYGVDHSIPQSQLEFSLSQLQPWGVRRSANLRIHYDFPISECYCGGGESWMSWWMWWIGECSWLGDGVCLRVEECLRALQWEGKVVVWEL